MRKKTETFKATRVLWLAVLALLLMRGTALQAQTNDEVWDGSVAEAFAGGSGTADDPYLISNGAQLAKLAQDVNGGEKYSGKYFMLTNDIVLNNTDGWEKWDENTEGLNEWTPIGDNSNNVSFNGTFDGDGHAVRGIYINKPEQRNMGLFAYNDNGTLKNVGVADGYIRGGDRTAGVCGNNKGTIEYCYNAATVVGGSSAGGVCGFLDFSKTVSYCYNTGKVSATDIDGDAGGICVSSNSTGTCYINNCYSIGEVSGKGKIGAILGVGPSGGDIIGSNNYYSSNLGLPACGDKYIGLATAKSADDFEKGMVCWLMNGSKADGVWKQTLGTDKSPTFSGQTVYPVYTDCNPTPTSFTNNQAESNTPTDDHVFDDNGICSKCHVYEPAVKNGDGAYEIGNIGQLYWFAELVNSIPADEETGMSSERIDAVLTADITVNKNVLSADGKLNGTPELKWIPIGRYLGNAGVIPYSGVFDGRGHTISGLYFDSEEEFTAGLFGAVSGGTVKNVGVADSYFETLGYAGGICGMIQSAVTTTDAGEDITYTALISNCWSSALVSGDMTNGVCGGVCGVNGGTIENSYSTGSLSGGMCGGVCGYNSDGTIENSYSTGSLSGGMCGGVCGYNESSSSSEKITGVISNCYWLSGTCENEVGLNKDGTIENVAAKTADEFKSGAVAVLLQGDQPEQAWGQAIGTDEYPVLTADGALRVYTAKMYNGTSVATDAHASASGFIMPEGSNAVAVIEPSVAVDANGTNVIVKNGDAYTCGSLVLTDGADFYTPVAFTAKEATYIRTLPSTSTWGTIALPFAVADVSGASLYQADGVVSDSGEESILAVIPTGGNTLDANTPALFKGENAGSEVSFSASGAGVAATADAGLTKTIGESGYELNGSMSTITLEEGDLFISKDQFWSVGTENKVGMQAFRAYIDAPASSPANVMRIMVGSTTDIRQALADGSRLVDVYSLQGILLRKGVESSKALNGLPAGVYVVGGKKVMSK